MEVAWEDRGSIARANSRKYTSLRWNEIHAEARTWWNRVYDACVNTEILHKSSGSPDGGMIKIVVTKQNKEEK